MAVAAFTAVAIPVLVLLSLAQGAGLMGFDSQNR